MLLAFKAARRQEYLQENLRVLGALRGETVETAYGPRWQSEGVRHRPPEPGEEALVIFTSRPYQRFTPARFGRVVEANVGNGLLRLVLELGSRAHLPDPDRWQRWVVGGPNPSEASQVWLCRSDEGAGGTEREGATPVEYVPAAQEERAWRRAIDRLVHDDDYARAVFLRVGSVRPADAAGAPALEPPYRLTAERAYLVRLVSYNPHLDDDFRRDLRLVPFHDQLATAVALDEPKGLPADGVVEMMVEPIVRGPGWLELHASRGADFLLAARLGWSAEAPAAETAPAPLPETAPVEAPRAVEQVEPLEAIDAASASLRASDAALRAYGLVRDAPADLRLALIDSLLELVPGDGRLGERHGVVLHELGRHAEAVRELGAIPLDTLGRDGRAAYIAAQLRLGRLPDPIERVRVADLTDDATFAQVLDASAGLPSDGQLRLTEFAVERLLSDDRAGRWLEALVERPLPRDALRRLVEAWQYVDPDRAGRVLERLVREGRLGLEDERVARLLHELARGAGLNGALRAAVEALAEAAVRRSDATGLIELLGQVRAELRRDDAHSLGERLIRSIADATPDEERIDAALLASADFIEDHRQLGDLDRANALATFASANADRASEETRARLDAVLVALTVALERSETFRRYAELRDREANHDLREAVARLRFLFVGGKRPEWYEALRTELALSERSEWVESERRKAPPMDVLEERLKRGRWAGVVVFKDRVGHKTSEPLIRLCRTHEVRLLEPRRLTRDALIAALREHFRE